MRIISISGSDHFRGVMYAWVVVALFACNGMFMGTTPAEPKPGGKDYSKSFYLQIPDSVFFEAISGEPLSEKFSRVSCVKLCYDIIQSKLYFINSKKYNLHYDFCLNEMQYPHGLMEFNNRNYNSGPRQEYILATLNYFRDQKVYVVEFSGNNNLDGKTVNTLYQEVVAKTFIGQHVRVNNNSTYLAALEASGELKIPFISPTELYRNQTFQGIQEGIAFGRLRCIEDRSELAISAEEGDIIITRGTPLQVPACSAFITDAIQSPLSHVQVLCHHRKIPCAAQTTIWSDSTTMSLDNQWVRLQIESNGIRIEKCTEEEVLRWRREKVPHAPIQLQSDLTVRKILNSGSFDLDDIQAIGQKAAAFGELTKLSKTNSDVFVVPENACAIPFYFYHEHMKSTDIQPALDAVLAMKGGTTSPEEVHEKLKALRKAIIHVPVQPALLKQIEDHIARDTEPRPYRFRSSCNAEDLPEFSGAGLYTSKTGEVGNPERSVERAIQKVWASTWSDAAWSERESHSMDHRKVRMGILVHRAFPDEALNGVAITRNMYRPDFLGFTVQIQKGDVSVVQPSDSIISEQLICMDASRFNSVNPDITTEYIAFSSYSQGASLLSKEETARLYKALDVIDRHFYRWTDWRKGRTELNYFAVDVEFKFDRNGKLYVKQARPYE